MGCTLAAALCGLAGGTAHADDSGNGVAPPGSHPFGKSYSQWAGQWWKWFLQLPLTNNAGAVHPAIDAGQANYSVREGQSGQVWFLAAPLFAVVERSATVPAGKALFFMTLGSEASSLECQGCGSGPCNSSPGCFCKGTSFGTNAVPVESYWANNIVNLAVTIDGAPVANPAAYRFHNAEIRFTAPSPWINSCSLGSTGGNGDAPGTSVGDGYYFFLNPLSAGAHTIHYSGLFHFVSDPYLGTFDAPLDMTYKITVQTDDDDEQ
jgi:hypothetical protein